MPTDWQGVDAFFGKLDQLAEAADGATRELVATVSTQLVQKSQQNFIGAHRRGEPHVGGKFPNVVTGETRRSIRADPITRFGTADYGTSVAPHVLWGRRLELGFNGSRGYPYFIPAARAIRYGAGTAGFRQQALLIWERHMSRV